MENSIHESINEVIVTTKNSGNLNTKLVSDKYHTFGDLYMERMILFWVICNQNLDVAGKSKKHFDEEIDPMFNGDFIVWLNTPEGIASYHFKLDFWDLFDNIKEYDRSPKYDGYKPVDALKRIQSIIK